MVKNKIEIFEYRISRHDPLNWERKLFITTTFSQHLLFKSNINH